MQSAASIERQLPHHTTVAVTYRNIAQFRHLKRTLGAYCKYYHRSRPHLALDKQCPVERQMFKRGAIIEMAELGGLHYRYEPIAA